MKFKLHKEKTDHNSNFLKLFYNSESVYKDWMITVIYYTALHCVDAYLAEIYHHKLLLLYQWYGQFFLQLKMPIFISYCFLY